MAIDFTPQDVGSGFNLTKLNENFQNIDVALQDALSRSGGTPNQMLADIDMNNNDLLNVSQTKTNELFINGSLVTPDALQTIPPSVMTKAQYDPANIGSNVFNGYPVASRSILKTLSTTNFTSVFLTESGREGEWKFTTGDFSAEVAADTAEGIYIKADDTASTVGAWVRVVNDHYLATWFGLVEGENTNNHTAIKSAIVAAAGVFPVVIPPGDYTLTGGITNNQVGTHLIGYGAIIRCSVSGTIIFRSLQPFPNVKIEGIHFIGGDVYTRGLWLGCDNATVYKCEFEGFGTNPVVLTNNPFAILLGGNGPTGIVTDGKVLNCYFHDNWGSAIGQSCAGRTTVAFNHIVNTGLHAITVDNVGAASCKVIGNTILEACMIGASGAIATDASQHLIVANNSVYGSGSWGLRTPNNVDNVDGMIVIGNVFGDCDSGGVSLFRNDAPDVNPGPIYCFNCLIDGNTFVNNGPSKVSIVIDDMGAGASGNKIGQNNVYRNSALPTYPKETQGTPISFYASFSADQDDVTGDSTDLKLVLNTAILNEGSGYNAGTGTFTAPRGGLYEFTLGVGCHDINSTVHQYMVCTIVTSSKGNWRARIPCSAASSFGGVQIKTPPLRLAAGDTVSAFFRVIGSSKVIDIDSGSGYTYFAGRMVHEW